MSDMETMLREVSAKASQVDRLTEENTELRKIINSMLDQSRTASASPASTEAKQLPSLPKPDVPEQNIRHSIKNARKVLCSEMMIQKSRSAFSNDPSPEDINFYMTHLFNTSDIERALTNAGSDGESCLRILNRYSEQLKRKISSKDYSERDEIASEFMSDVIGEMRYQFLGKLVSLLISRNKKEPKVWGDSIIAVNKYLSALGFYTVPVPEGTRVDDIDLDMEFFPEDTDRRELDGIVKSIELPAYYVDYPIGDEITPVSISGKCTVYHYNGDMV